MKRFLFAVGLVCMGAASFAAIRTEYTKLLVLKGTVTETVHYVYNDTLPDTQALADERAALGVDAIGKSLKPKVYYYLIVEVTYKPQINAATGKWTSEGDIDVWTMGALEYGKGRHDDTGVYQAALLYAYDVGPAFDLYLFDHWQSKKKGRTGDGWVLCMDEAGTFVNNREGIADLVYSAKLVKSKTDSTDTWYEPSISSLTFYCNQVLDQKIGSKALVWQDTQFGVGKIVFKVDSKLTTTANLTDVDGVTNIGLAQVATTIRDTLVKAGYPSVLMEPDPYNYYP